MDGRSQTGIVCGSSVDDYENDIIKKHEFTRPEKELDRINHIKTTGAQTGNVFLAYRNVDSIDELITKWKSSHDPVYNFTADDGISHTIWVISADETVSTLTEIIRNRSSGYLYRRWSPPSSFSRKSACPVRQPQNSCI